MGCTPKYHYLGFSSSWNVKPIFCLAHDCKVTLVLWSSPGQALVCSAWIAAFPVWMVTHGDPWWLCGLSEESTSEGGGNRRGWATRGEERYVEVGMLLWWPSMAQPHWIYTPTSMIIGSSMIHYDQNYDPHPSHLALPVWESSPICCSPAATLDVGWRIVRSGFRAIAWGHSPFHLALSITDVWKREEEVPTVPCKYWLGTLMYFDI